MKRALSVALIICLVKSAVPAGAQERLEATSGPIARSIAREAVLLAAVQPSAAPTDAGWDRVRNLGKESEVLVTVRGSQPVTRYFVAATESELTVREFGQTITTIARSDISEIRSRHVPRHPAAFGALIGVGSGLGVGLASFGTDLCGSDGCYGGALLALFAGIGAGVGAGIGAAVGGARKHKVDLIYRAPLPGRAARPLPLSVVARRTPGRIQL
jgi:hypothetical protein